MTAEQRAGLSDAALAMTQPCIDELIKDISKRVQKAGAITDTAEYQIYRAQALGEGKKAIEQAVSKQIGISEEVIASLFEYVADKSLRPDENGSLKRMTEAYTRMTQSKTRELLRDLWADTPEGKVQPLQTAYARAMDFAFRQVATGTLDLNTAIRRAVTPLAKRGLRTIEQKSGRSVGIASRLMGFSSTKFLLSETFARHQYLSDVAEPDPRKVQSLYPNQRIGQFLLFPKSLLHCRKPAIPYYAHCKKPTSDSWAVLHTASRQICMFCRFVSSWQPQQLLFAFPA